jgi:hypothetical protein
MKTTNFFTFLLCLILFQTHVSAQVGIGTTTPDDSAILDMESTTQGVLTPRMTTVQRVAIATPADGLLVFDTDESVFYFYDGTSWVPLESAEKRDNYKLIKSAADLADELVAGGGSKYLLTTDFMYEINGTITLAAPIDLNGAYLIGEDTNEDILYRAAGTIFEGATGGSIRGVTLSVPGGTVFNLSGSAAKTERFVFRDCVVANSNSVGSISSFGLVFISVVQFVNNTAGITYESCNQLLLTSLGWGSDNGGTYETFVGDFDIITKQGGFSKITTANYAMDITGITSLTNGGLRIVDFYGGGNYINGTSPYAGHNFPNNWDVNSPGILVETDGVAAGNFYSDSGLTTGFSQNISNGTSVEVQGNGSFIANGLFRFTADQGDNRLIYDGKKTREFQINASMSVRVDATGVFYAFMIAKNNVVVVESNSVVYIANATQIQNVSINANIDLAPGDHIQIYVQRLTGSGTDELAVFSENLSIK